MGILRDPECTAARMITRRGRGTQPPIYRSNQSVFHRGLPGGGPARRLIPDRGTTRRSETKLLDQYSRDLTEMAARGELDPVIGRETEIQRVIQILSRRTKNNPVLIGEPAWGRRPLPRPWPSGCRRGRCRIASGAGAWYPWT